MMIPLLRLSDDAQRHQIEALLHRQRLDPRDVALSRGERSKMVATVNQILADVAERGDDALVEASRKFDDAHFTAAQIRVDAGEMREAAARVPAPQMTALRRAIAQVKQYQVHILPQSPRPLVREGVQLGLRFTPVESAGLYFPGGKASYPSSLIMLAVPAQVAGVKNIVVCTPPSKYGRSDLVLAACHELGLKHVFRAGGAAAIAAMAFGTATIPAVDKIVGPGNEYVQLAKRALAGCVGIDSFLGPSEILVIADETGNPAFIAADMIAQAEHDPGSCLLLTTSEQLARDVSRELAAQSEKLDRVPAIGKSLRERSAIVIEASVDRLIDYANRFAPEHVNLQTRDNRGVLTRLMHAGCVFVGPWSPVAAGDYIAGPSHCLPTNTTARFSSGISVYEFLKRSSVVQYERAGLVQDAPHIAALAEAEDLAGHAASIRVRG